MTSGPNRAARATTADLLAVLWPEGLRSPSARSVGRLDGYVAVPDLERARLLLPRDPRAAAAVLRDFRPGGGPRERARIGGLLTLLHTTGGSPLARGRVLPAGERTLERHLAGLLGEPVVVGVQLGPPRANRKPCLQVLDAHRRPLAFAKVGVGPLTDVLVRNEGAALRTLATRELPGVRVPRVLEEDEWEGHALLLTEALPLRATRRDDLDRLVRAMVTVAASAPGGDGWLEALRSRSGERRELLDRVTEGAASWRTGCWHGDWTAWNAATHDGEVLVWDWERYADQVPLGWDALHAALRAAIAGTTPTPGTARRLLDRSRSLLAAFGVEPEHASGVASAYLLEVAARYTEDGQADAGGRSGRVEEWLVPVLEERWAS